jgi:hypothetical protein
MNMRFLLGTTIALIAFLALLPFLPGAVEVSNAADATAYHPHRTRYISVTTTSSPTMASPSAS